MTIDQLIYYSEVYRQKSINAASFNLHIAQQSLSTSIRELEKECSTTFFIRSRKGVTPTKAGERFYQSVQLILCELAMLRHDLDTNNVIDNCRIGLFSSLSSAVSSQLFTLLTKSFPNVFFDFSAMTYNEFISMPVQAYPDIIFNFIFKDKNGQILDLKLPPNFQLKYVSKAPKTLRIWVSTASPLAKYKVLTPRHLAGIALCFPKHQSDRASVLNYFNRSHVYPAQQYFAETEEIFIALLKSGAYATSELCIDNRPLIHPNLLNEPDLVLKPLSSSFEKVYFVLLYRDSFQQFYPIMADYLNQNYNG